MNLKTRTVNDDWDADKVECFDDNDLVGIVNQSANIIIYLV